VSAPSNLAPSPTLEPPGSRPTEVPFSLVDEVVHLLDDSQAPWSIQLEVRVGGRLDEKRMLQALVAATDAHPMAGAQMVASTRWSTRDRWSLGRRRDGDVLRVLDCFDDDQLAAARSELQSLPLTLTTGAPLRAWLAHHPDGDVLMLNVHHAAMDGFGALRVLRSVVRAYAGQPDPSPTVDFLEARELPSRLTEAGPSTRLRRTLALAERLWDLAAPPARIAREGSSSRDGYAFQARALTTAETGALLGLDHPGTVNDVLVAALHLTIGAWNAEHGATCERIGVLVPANLRPGSWRDEVAGNFALPARTSTVPRARRSRRAAVAAITEQTTRKKRTGMGTALLQLLDSTRGLPLWAKRAGVRLIPLTGDRMVDTSMFSNLGVITEPLDFGGAAGAADEIWFSPPAHMPLGVAIGAVTMEGRLHLSFRHRHQQFGNDAASRFADRYMAELAHLIADLSPKRRLRRGSAYGLGSPPPVYPAYRHRRRRRAA
jgi:NRPS condensation-like uncharacterized protein